MELCEYGKFRNKLTWKGANHEYFDIRFMEISHILNCLRILKSRKMRSSRKEYIEYFNLELKLRSKINSTKPKFNTKLIIVSYEQ